MIPILEKIHEKGKYCPTIKDVRKWHGILNEAVFDGVIPKFSDVKIKKCRGHFALARPINTKRKSCHLEIDFEFSNFKKFLIVLAHEMIHCWEWVKNDKMTHGKTFFQWREKLAEHEIPLSKGYHIIADDKVIC